MAFILKSALFIIDKNKSILRYAVATLAMFSNAALALLTFFMVYPDTSSGINSNLSPIPLTSLVNELTQKSALLSYHELLPSILAHSLPYLSLLWLTTITILACKLLIEVRNVNNLPLHSSISPSSALLIRFNELAQQIKLTKTPKLLISLKAEVPMAIGWLKPVVLLPASMVTGLDSAQLEMLILHELAHIRRHDYLVNFLQTLIELLFFFHPSVHWIGKQMRNEREYCSDDIAVQHCGDAIAYAHTLTDTASLCAKNHFHTIPTMAMAASGGDLKARVLRLVDHHCAPSNNTSKWLAAISLLLALTLLSINQLLTMPFAQQLNDQFPWQESNSLSKNIFQSRLTGFDNSHAEKQTMANDSIAQQLLSRENSFAKPALVGIANNENNTKTAFINNSKLTTAALKSLAVIQSQVSVEPVLKTAPIFNQEFGKDKIKTAELALTYEQVTFQKQLDNSNEKQTLAQLNLANDEVSKIKGDLVGKTSAQTIIEPKQTIYTPTMNTLTQSSQITKAKQAFKSAVITTKLDPIESFDKKFPVTFNNALPSNTSAYTHVSYRQEIDQLARQNDLYVASHALNSITSVINKVNELAVSSNQTAIEAPSSHEAKLLNSISPVYPSLAKRRGIEMEVKVNFTIDRYGKVKDINFSPQSKLIYFKSAIRSAIRKWRFSPATKNNRTIESKMSKIFSFSLHA
ncbi:M56 family metallopeptidase [Colwellia sp.]|uniref:M56 family metallopeptidase n=1 Tax=Colwellia sp. TaxID=56799 RepID=UPI0025BFEE2E|nr:M56 family metallopeptidase [Colwellia sp.]